MFAQLGSYTFEGVKSPNAMSETHSVKYGQIPLINAKDVIQPTGGELTELNLAVLFAIEFCEPKSEIDSLLKSMRAFEVLPFIFGDGTILGSFVIREVEISNEKYSRNGALEKASVNIKLTEQAYAKEYTVTPSAVSSAKPRTEPPQQPVITEASAIVNNLNEGRTKSSAIKNIGDSVGKGTTSLKRGIRDIKILSRNLSQAFTTAKKKIETSQKIYDRASQLPASLDEAIRYGENLTLLENTVDIATFNRDIENLTRSVGKVTKHAVPIFALRTTREGGF